MAITPGQPLGLRQLNNMHMLFLNLIYFIIDVISINNLVFIVLINKNIGGARLDNFFSLKVINSILY